MLYLITYSLSKNKDYTAFYDAIKSYPAWWHYIDNTWIIKASGDIQVIYDKLSPYIDKVEDNLLILKIDPAIGNKQGWLPKKAWDWIKNHRD